MPNSNLLTVFSYGLKVIWNLYKSYSVMFGVHIEIALLASPVNQSVNLRTGNNMGFTFLHKKMRNICTMNRLSTKKRAKTYKSCKNMDSVRRIYLQE